MSSLDHLVDHLVASGYRGIVLHLVQSDGEQHGMHVKTDVYDVFARAADNKIWKLKLFATSSGTKPPALNHWRDDEIDDQKYEQAVREYGGMRDTPAWYEEMAKIRERRFKIDQELKSLIPVCPFCGKSLVVRQNRRGDHFLGCQAHPRCLYTQPLDKDVRSRLMSLQSERHLLDSSRDC